MLRAECARTTQRAVAERLGVSQSVVNQTLRGKYRGRLDRLEQRVRGELMRQTIECPVLGDLSRLRCQDIQEAQRRASWVNNDVRRALAGSCPSCPHGGPR